MRSGRFLFLVLSLSLFAIGLAGCDKKKTSAFSYSRNKTPFKATSREQVVRVNIHAEPKTLDPRKVHSLHDANIVKMFMEGLTRIDKSGHVVLALAQEMAISEDQKVYRFTLRPAKWSNGDPITSHDFAYAWKKSLSPLFTSPLSHMLYVIKNGKESKEGRLPISLLGIETPDERSLVVSLIHPLPHFLELLSMPIFFPVPSRVDPISPHWAERDELFVASGPFKMAKWNRGSSIVAERNEHYWEENVVPLQKITLVMVSEEIGVQMFSARDLEWNGSPFCSIPVDAIESLKEEKKLGIAPTLATSLIRINTKAFPFKSAKMRRAFACAIKRNAIVGELTQENQIPATAIIPQVMGLAQEPYFVDGDGAMASSLFQEALGEMGVKRETFPEITLLYSPRERFEGICLAIQQQWQDAFGIEVKIEAVGEKAFEDRINNGDYTLALGSYSATPTDPLSFLEMFRSRSLGDSAIQWESPRYAALLEASYSCQQVEEREKLLQESQRVIMEEMPVIPLFHSAMLYMKEQKLRNVLLAPTGEIDFKWAYLEE